MTAHQDDKNRSQREPTPGGGTGGGGIGSDAVPLDSPGSDQAGIVGSGAVWHHDAAAGQAAGGGDSGRNDLSRPGVLGDETEEQDLGQPGDPGARITRDEVETAFAGDKPRRPDYPDELVVPDDGEKR